MSSHVELSSVGSKKAHFDCDVEVQADHNDVRLIITHLGNKNIYKPRELLYTDDGKTMLSLKEYRKARQCTTREIFSDHFQSIGFRLENNTLTPVLSSIKII